jgi:hypothetical protein
VHHVQQYMRGTAAYVAAESGTHLRQHGLRRPKAVVDGLLQGGGDLCVQTEQEHSDTQCDTVTWPLPHHYPSPTVKGLLCLTTWSSQLLGTVPCDYWGTKAVDSTLARPRGLVKYCC